MLFKIHFCILNENSSGFWTIEVLICRDSERIPNNNNNNMTGAEDPVILLYNNNYTYKLFHYVVRHILLLCAVYYTYTGRYTQLSGYKLEYKNICIKIY